jgi:hypothetical protein
MFATASLHRGLLGALPTTLWVALSVGAAAIHFAVIPDHLEEWWAFGLFFAVLGWFQAVWPVAYVNRPSRRLAWIAISVNLATVVLWAWSRTVGLPVGPEPGMPEGIGAADLIATALELALVLGLLATRSLTTGQSGDAPSSARREPIGALNLAIWAVVAALSTAAIALGAA